MWTSTWWIMPEYIEPVVPPQSQSGMPMMGESVVGTDAFLTEVPSAASQVDQLNAYLEMLNIANALEEDILTEIGSRVVEDYEIDKASRSEWEDTVQDAIELAKLTAEKKYYAGEVVANVKYPTLATAAVQFSARALPNIIKGRDVVKCKVVGASDPPPAPPQEILNGELLPEEGTPEMADQVQDIYMQRREYRGKHSRAARIARFMSWQFLEDIDDWRDNLDQLLVSVAVVGSAFKKTFFDGVKNKAASVYVSADDLVVNYAAKSLESAPRVTHILEFKPNDIEERVRSGVFLDKDFGEPDASEDSRDEDAPHTFLEQHRWWDLDDDGYQEPYVVTVHLETRQVVRITPRYDADGIFADEKGNILKIEPVQYFTKFLFMPAFDGNFYGMGLGTLMAPLNATINTTINQLLDAGTRSTRQGGFLGKGIQLGRNDILFFKSGEWKRVNNTGDDLRKGIVPLPAAEPSKTLFELLSLMIDASKEVSSVSDVLTGEQQGANQSPTTTLSLIEQGLKVFSSIYDRIHRSLKSEFKKVWRLNRLYLDSESYMVVLDDSEAVIDDFYDKDMDVVPVSNETELSHTQKMVKADALMQMMGSGLNDREIQRRYLEALDVPDIEKLLPPENVEEEPPPEVQVEMAKIEIEQQKLEVEKMRAEADAALIESKIRKNDADILRSEATARQTERQAVTDEHMEKLDNLTRIVQMQTSTIEKLASKVMQEDQKIAGMEETAKKDKEKEKLDKERDKIKQEKPKAKKDPKKSDK